jgi:hypothetical protein
MTAGKVLIGGTAYDIKGGKTLIGGTAYDIKGGKTLIGGTGYDIGFGLEQSFPALMAHAVQKYRAGRSSSSSASVSFTLTESGTYYIFSCMAGNIGIYKWVYDHEANTRTVTQLIRTSTSSCGLSYVTSNGDMKIYYNSSGSGGSGSGSSVRGCAMTALQFTGYTETEIDYIITHTTFTRLSGANGSGSSGNPIYITTYYDGYVLVADNYIALSKVQYANKNITQIWSNKTTEPTNMLMWYQPSGGTDYYTALTLDGSSPASTSVTREYGIIGVS